MEKQAYRDMFLKRRKLLDPKMHQLFNFMLLDKLSQFLDSVKPKTVAIFYPMHNEVDLRSLEENYQLYYPKIKGNQIVFYKDVGVFEKAPFNTTVPAHNNQASLDEIDVMIVPGLVFGHNFYRIGYGKGYYDECLSRYKGVKIGVCFELFLLETVPIETHDEALDIIVTDQRILKR
ncbi:MAG: 5-formyltetrahydrofolate cyclo-ligase [Candidatus Izemoplasmataceae bacterium]